MSQNVKLLAECGQEVPASGFSACVLQRLLSLRVSRLCRHKIAVEPLHHVFTAERLYDRIQRQLCGKTATVRSQVTHEKNAAPSGH